MIAGLILIWYSLQSQSRPYRGTEPGLRNALKGITTKYILRKALEGVVPQEILHRKKHGFGVPVGRWFRHELKDYVREVLLSPQALCRGYFREEALRQLIEEHQSGRRDHGHRLWALLTFEMWHRVFVDERG